MNLVGATNGNINALGGAQVSQQNAAGAALSAGMLAQQLANLGLTAAGTTSSSSPQGTLAAAAAVSSLLQQQNQQQNAAALNQQQNAAAQKPAASGTTGSGMSAQAYPTRTKEQMINLIREDKIMCHNETWGYKTSVGEQNFLKPFDQEEMEIWRELEPFVM